MDQRSTGTTQADTTSAAGSDFHTRMARSHVTALWERHERQRNGKPAAEPSFLWRWDDLRPLIDDAVRLAPMDSTERRVLTLSNPFYGDGDETIRTTNNLIVGLQILMPGETAPPHRHSMNALRFVIEGEGACTIVDGKRCDMNDRDMILTPAWTWHEHVHRGDGRVVWVDVLDVPLHRALHNVTFQPGPAHDVPPQPPDPAFATGGFMPMSFFGPAAHSPMFRYGWAAAQNAIRLCPPGPDGARELHYVDPMTAGSVMTLIDCSLLALPEQRWSNARQTDCNAVCVVAEGKGRSRVGSHEFRWQRNDIFTVPFGAEVAHCGESKSAQLFVVNDHEIFRRLGLLDSGMASSR